MALYGLNAYFDVTRRILGKNLGLSLYLHSYFVYGSSKGSGKSAPEHSLLDIAIGTKISCTGSTMIVKRMSVMDFPVKIVISNVGMFSWFEPIINTADEVSYSRTQH